MGIGKWITKKIATKTVTALTTSVVAGKTADKVVKGIDRVLKVQTASEVSKRMKGEYLIIKAKTSEKGMSGKKGHQKEIDYGPYAVFDKKGRVQYRTETGQSLFLGHNYVCLYSMKNEMIGKVEEAVRLGVPVFEKDINECTIEYGERQWRIRRFTENGFGLEEAISYENVSGGPQILHSNGKNFRIRSRGRIIARMYEVAYEYEEGYANRYIMEYTNESEKEIGLLFVFAIQLLRKKR